MLSRRFPIVLDPCCRYFSAGYIAKKTKIPTFHFQKSLPRLPIPELDKTLERYLAAVEPVVDGEMFEQTKQAVADFKSSGVGQQLHGLLQAKDKENKHTSYINQWWFDMYTKDRQSIVVNYNPQVRIKDDPTPAKNSQNQRAASLIASSIRFYRTLKDGRLEPDIFHTKPKKSKTDQFNSVCSFLPEFASWYGAYAYGAYPLDMSQYKNLFASTRIPKVIQDELKVFDTSKHIVVQRGIDFYKVEVLNDDGSMKSEEHILANIDAILGTKLVLPKDGQSGVGIFTTLDRDTWAKERSNLVESNSVNKASIEAIDSALFVVALEHTSPDTHVDMSRCFLLGDGGNHWFDKSFQLIVAANGKASVNFEHSWGDGVAVLRYLNEMYEDSIKYPVISSTSTQGINKLDWELSDETKNAMRQAQKVFNATSDRLLIESAETPVTRDVASLYDIGMDGVLQMSIQLAHYRLHQGFASTYESASTSAFRHGRTETIRSCTNEAVQFCKAMDNPNLSNVEKEGLLRNAVTKHGELTKNGVMGQGCDRHLFGMKTMALEKNIPLPDLFTIPATDIMNRIILSTSTLSSPNLEGGSFGPVNEDCYGIGYGAEKEGSLFQLASYRKDLPDLRDLLSSSIQDIEKLLQHGKSK